MLPLLQKIPFLFLLFIFVIGCSENHVIKDAKNAPSQAISKQVTSTGILDRKPGEEWKTLISELQTITIVTNEGFEIDVNKNMFQDKFQKYPQWEMANEAASAVEYKVLLKAATNQTTVLGISEQGVKWENHLYTGPGAQQLSEYIKEAAAKGLFQQLQVDRILVSAKDLDQSNQISEKEMKPLLEMLKKANYIKGNPRLHFPLFPYYVLEIDSGGKQIIQVDILSPTVISLKLGQKKLYYQTNDSLYTPLKGEISLPEYSPQNIKYLFKATDVRAVSNAEPSSNTELLINREKMDDFEAQSVIHYLVRELAKAKKTDETKKTEQSDLTLLFTLSGVKVPVYIFKDSYLYKGNTYSKIGILEEMRNILKNEGFFKN